MIERTSPATSNASPAQAGTMSPGDTFGQVGEQIRAIRPCPLTGDHAAEIVAVKDRHGGALRNVISLASGLVRVDPLPRPDLASFYRDEYRLAYKQTYVPRRKHVVRAGRVALDRHQHSRQSARPGMRTLDIGAGGGEWVYLLQRMGCDAQGIEPNTGYASFAREHYGVNIFNGMHQDADFEPESFDLLSLYQVLEHLPDPVDELRQMSRFLKTGGIFLIEVPDILFPGMRFANKWHDGHLFGFDALTLEAVAARAGLKKRFITVLPGNIFGVFEKCGQTELPVPSLHHHHHRVRAEIATGKTGYWTLPETWSKVPRRLVQRISEYRASNRASAPGVILDRLYT